MAEQKNGAWGLDSIVGQLCILWIALFSKKSRNLHLFKTKAFLADIIPSRFLQTGPCECRETQPWRHSLYSLSFTESRILSETGCAPENAYEKADHSKPLHPVPQWVECSLYWMGCQKPGAAGYRRQRSLIYTSAVHPRVALGWFHRTSVTPTLKYILKSRYQLRFSKIFKSLKLIFLVILLLGSLLRK